MIDSRSQEELVQDMILESIRETVLSFPDGGAKGVAAKIGKPYSTMMRELNLFDAGAKLGVLTLISMIRVTRNVSPVRILAAACGFDLVPCPNAPDPDHAD